LLRDLITTLRKLKRCIDIIASSGWILICTPLFLFAWLGLKLRRVRPVFIRDAGSQDYPAGFRLFNTSGNDRFSGLVRDSGIDLLPIALDVLAGSACLQDAARFVSRVSILRHRPPTRRALLVRGLLLFIATCIFVVLTFQFFKL
jgi:hypothetical protein